MPSNRLIVYADFNCPLCFTLHERLIDLGYMSQVDWRSVEHEASARYDANAMHTYSELTEEVTHIREISPKTNIIIPAGRPNSRSAIAMVSQAHLIDPQKAILFRTLIYRALWQHGEDISEDDLIEKLRIEAGLPEIAVSDGVILEIKQWKYEWENGNFSNNIPAMLTDTGNKILGLPNADVIDASLHDNNAEMIEENACCYLKRKEKILIASNNNKTTNKLAAALEDKFQLEVSLNGEMAYDICQSANPPDLILMDVDLATLTGYETCLKIKDNPNSQNISVILFSNKKPNEANSKHEIKAFDSRANDFINTPCADGVIRARVRVQLHLKRSTELLEQFSRIDSLTQISNRREFDRTLDKEWLRAKRAQSPISAILLDIDLFKDYNDHYGHLEGDACLKEVAQIIEQSIRRSQDTVARYGGEEFIIILPDTTKNGAQKVAKQIIQALATKAIPHEKSPIAGYITASLGISTVTPKPELKPKNLIDSADIALYAAKNAGRNCFV